MLDYPSTSAQSPSYWQSYSYPGLASNYDPYLTSHYDYSQYYPAPAQEPVIDNTTTTEDITFAEAFTALANFEPNIATEEISTQTDVNAKPSATGTFENQHLQTFNEINSG